jgi:C4-dicarboxylate-specific signal transduction histidine kinase
LVEEVARLMHRQCAERNISLEKIITPNLPPLELDAVQMEQVLINLLKNAIEAVGNDGAISILLANVKGCQELRIRDSGPGVAPAVRAHLFTPFYTNKKDGRGIGLTLVQEILLAHCFDYSLDDRAEGGAEFRILLTAPAV